MPRALSRLLPSALLGAWTALFIFFAAPTWFPRAALVRRVVETFIKSGTPEAGILYAIHHHAEMAVKVCVLHLVLAGAGAAAARLLCGRWRLDWLVAWGLGFGIVSAEVLALGLTGLILPGPLFVSTALPGLAGLCLAAPGGWRLAKDAVRSAASGLGPFGRFVVAACAVAAAVSIGLALTPDTSWDAVVYHLRVPAFYIEEHRIFYMPTHHFTAFPLATEMHNLWLMAWGGLDRMGGGQAPKLFHYSCALVAAACAFRLVAAAAPGSARRAGWLGALLVLVNPLTGTIAIRGYNDFAMAALPALALMVLIENRAGAAVVAGALCGVALSIKYTAVMVMLPLAFLWFRFRPWPYVLAAAAVAPWVVKNALLTGNPAAPFLTSIFVSSPESQFQLSSYAASVGAMSLNPRNFAGAVSYLFRGGSGESLSELLPILVPAAFLLSGGVRPNLRMVVYTGAFGALWMILTPNIRFFAPAVAPLAALAAAGFVRLEGGRRRWLKLAFASVVVLNLVRLPLAHISLFKPLPFVFGRETVWDSANRQLFPAPYFGRLARVVNRQLAEDSRLLVMIDIKSHYLWRRSYHDFQYVMPGLYLRWLRSRGSLPGLLKKLREEGITHVFVVQQRTRDVGRHYSWRGDELAVSAEFLGRCTVPVARTEMTELLEIVPERAKPRDLDGMGWMLFMHVENLIIEGRAAEARELLERTLRKTPWLRGLRAYLGVSLGALGRYEDALAQLSAGVAEGGEQAPRAAFAAGEIKRFLGDRDGAEKSWLKAIELRPTYDEARFKLGVLLYELGRKEDGLRQIAVAVRLRPENAEYARAFEAMASELGLR